MLSSRFHGSGYVPAPEVCARKAADAEHELNSAAIRSENADIL
jgi:hypothetical protein